jgi:hypothetical protein
MGKKIHERSDEDLAKSLAAGELAPRKKAIAEEVLRRRYASGLGAELWLRMLSVVAWIRAFFSRN